MSLCSVASAEGAVSYTVTLYTSVRYVFGDIHSLTVKYLYSHAYTHPHTVLRGKGRNCLSPRVTLWVPVCPVTHPHTRIHTSYTHVHTSTHTHIFIFQSLYIFHAHSFTSIYTLSLFHYIQSQMLYN